MNFRKIVALLLVVFMVVTMVAGCKSTDDQYESAFKDDLVNNNYGGNSNDSSDDDQNQNQNQNETPDDDQNQQPSGENNTGNNNNSNTNNNSNNNNNNTNTNNNNNNNNTQTPDDEQPKDETPDEETPDEEDPKVEVQYDEANFIKVVDYNIRCANDGTNKQIADRAPRLLALLDKYDPDIIGLQESVPEWNTYLERDLLDEYEMRYKYRAESSLECTPILWKKDKFELLDEGYYWLSETPDQESIGWGAKHYRICNYAVLKIKATGKIFVFVNTHLQGGTPATNSAPLIANRTKQVGGFTKYPVILTGDFNYAPWSEPYGAFIMNGFIDLNDALGFNTAYTNNGYNEKPDNDSTNSIKDYIMFGGEEDMIHPFTYKILNENYFGGWISDHRGLYGEFAIL